MSRVDLDTNRSALQQAFNEVTNPKNPTDWVLYSYDGKTSVLKVVEKGDGGIEEMVDELNSGKVMYAYCQITDPNTDLPKLVCINWQGEGVPENKKGVYAHHITDVNRFFRGVHVTIMARTEDDVDEDDIKKRVAKASGANYSIHKEKPQPNANKPSGPISSVYVKTRPHQEIKSDVREKFWQKQHADEKKRQDYNRQKSVEEQNKLDKDTKDRELTEAQDREQRERARLQKITEIKQAEKRANEKNKEQEQQQWEKTQLESRKDEEERSNRANQLRKTRAAEAHSLVTNRDNNPRSAFEQKPMSQFDEPQHAQRAAPPPRKLKYDFGPDKQEDTSRKQPIKLPTEDLGQSTRAASPPAAPPAVPSAALPAVPSAAPSAQPHTRNLLAEGLPPRQDSDNEQEDQDWDAKKAPSPEPSTEDFSLPKASVPEPEPEETYDDVVHVQSYRQPEPEPQQDAYDDDEPEQELYDDVTVASQPPQEELYDDVSAMSAGGGPPEELYDDVSVTRQQGYDPELGLVAKALYDYQAMEDNEITFDPDDIITNIDQVDPGWWVGVAPNGSQGMFPSNYVEMLNG